MPNLLDEGGGDLWDVLVPVGIKRHQFMAVLTDHD